MTNDDERHSIRLSERVLCACRYICLYFVQALLSSGLYWYYVSINDSRASEQVSLKKCYIVLLLLLFIIVIVY